MNVCPQIEGFFVQHGIKAELLHGDDGPRLTACLKGDGSQSITMKSRHEESIGDALARFRQVIINALLHAGRHVHL